MENKKIPPTTIYFKPHIKDKIKEISLSEKVSASIIVNHIMEDFLEKKDFKLKLHR